MWDFYEAGLQALKESEPTKPAFDEATARDFLTILCGHFARATEGMDHPGLMQLSVLYPDGKSKLMPRRFRINDLEGMVQHAKDYAESGHNVYVEGRTVRDLEGTKRGTLKDTRWVIGLVIDSDADKDMAGVLPPGVEPTLIVESSGDTGNRHEWFIFDRAIPADEAKEIGGAMSKAVGADHDTGNPVQPYRLAGTPVQIDPAKLSATGLTLEDVRAGLITESAFDASEAVCLRSPLSTLPAGIIAPTFPQRSPPSLLTTAACGGLGSAT
jgi:hypothetical protein